MDSGTATAEGVSAIESGQWTTVNRQTGLSTDYLNHFNEVVMTFELIASMPDCIDELADWRPMTYAEHFRQSGLRDGAAAIRAYGEADPTIRRVFDEIILNLSTVLLDGVSEVRHLTEEGRPEVAALKVEETVSLARRLIDRASAVVNGYDVMRDPADTPQDDPQALADALFD